MLQISQLREELKGVESTLNAPISPLRFEPPLRTDTQTHTLTNLIPSHSFTLFLSLDFPLILHSSLLPSFPPSLQRLVPRSQRSFLCLNCAHHNRTNDAPLLCHTSSLCPLVLLLGNRPEWHFYFIFLKGGCGSFPVLCRCGCTCRQRRRQ